MNLPVEKKSIDQVKNVKEISETPKALDSKQVNDQVKEISKAFPSE